MRCFRYHFRCLSQGPYLLPRRLKVLVSGPDTSAAPSWFTASKLKLLLSILHTCTCCPFRMIKWLLCSEKVAFSLTHIHPNSFVGHSHSDPKWLLSLPFPMPFMPHQTYSFQLPCFFLLPEMSHSNTPCPSLSLFSFPFPQPKKKVLFHVTIALML